MRAQIQMFTCVHTWIMLSYFLIYCNNKRSAEIPRVQIWLCHHWFPLREHSVITPTLFLISSYRVLDEAGSCEKCSRCNNHSRQILSLRFQLWTKRANNGSNGFILCDWSEDWKLCSAVYWCNHLNGYIIQAAASVSARCLPGEFTELSPSNGERRNTIKTKAGRCHSLLAPQNKSRHTSDCTACTDTNL